MRLIQLLSWGILIYIGYRVLQGFLQSKRKEETPAQPKGRTAKETTETYQDPVCGSYVTADEAVIGRNGNERVHFCSMECLEKFRQQLEQQAAREIKE